MYFSSGGILECKWQKFHSEQNYSSDIVIQIKSNDNSDNINLIKQIIYQCGHLGSEGNFLVVSVF